MGLALRERAGLLEGLRPCFARTQVWLQAGKYVAALAGGLPRVNGWSVARHGGDRAPDKTQRLLNHASWDEVAAMSMVRRFAVAGLDDAARRIRRAGGMTAGALDETGQQKQGACTAGVKRQYLGSTWDARAGSRTALTRCCATRRRFVSLAQRGEIGGKSLDLMADLDLKSEGKNSMPENRWSCPGVGVMRREIRAIWLWLDCMKP